MIDPVLAGILQILLVLAALAACHVPLGDYMARTFSSERHLAPERAIYRVCGIDPDAEQGWRGYLRALLAFSLCSVLLLYTLQRVQQWLPLSLGNAPVEPDQAWNTAVSFTTNTNWQSYGGETTMGHLVQMAGLAVQNFVSAAVGIAVAVALIRGLSRQRTDRIGSFWVDLVRASLRVLLPIAAVFAIVLLIGGAPQTFADPTTVTTLAGGSQTIPVGPVASQEVIKVLGTNGGGFFNANSAHPFENPTAWTNLVQIFLVLLIPTALPRTFGTMVGDRRQGMAVLGAMSALYLTSLGLLIWCELANPLNLEGRESRLGVIASAFFGTTTTMTSTGAVDSFHSSYSPLGGGLLDLNMLLGEISPGGVGTGLYGMLIVAILAVFIAGLMVGRTPEYLGKKIGPRQIKLAAIYLLTMPALVLLGTGIALAIPEARESILNPGPHGLTEVLYAFTSGSNNNGSAFAGLNANTMFYNVGIALAMLFGRFVPIAAALALAGSFAEQGRMPATAGTLPTHTPLFSGLMVGVALLVSALTFLPALALGPIAEALS
ncbi:Potassium-transporting ATPase potassium-binding subunit [Pseudoclavibacter triregionum]|nr:Potassium-transporting ATPase potassium-binding subunit [Pseudoclavibacter triregionum]